MAILLVILERRTQFIGYLREDVHVPFYWVNLRGDLVEFFYLCSKLCWRVAGVSFYDQYFSWRAGHLDKVIL